MFPGCLCGDCGKSVSEGDSVGCGEVALRCLTTLLLPSSTPVLSFLVFSFSSVACRLSSSDDLGSFGFNTPLNMTLYRSSLISGISTLRKPGPPAELEDTGFGTLGQESSCWRSRSAAGSRVGTSSSGSVLVLITMGVCFGVFLPATVLFLEGVALSAVLDDGVVVLFRLAAAVSAVLAELECLRPPNNEVNNLLFCVLVL